MYLSRLCGVGHLLFFLTALIWSSLLHHRSIVAEESNSQSWHIGKEILIIAHLWYYILNTKRSTVVCKLVGKGYFWLETRVIIKISTNILTYIPGSVSKWIKAYLKKEKKKIRKSSGAREIRFSNCFDNKWFLTLETRT